MYTRCLFIFRQDLRVVDNTALFLAMQQSREVIPVFVFDAEILNSFSHPDGRIGFLVDTLAELKKQLQAYGSDLLVLYGKSSELVPKLLTKSGCDACFWNRSYGKGSLSRDIALRSFCSENGVAVHTSQDYLLVEPQDVPVRKVFTPFYHLRQAVPKRLPNYSNPERKPFSGTSREYLGGILVDLESEVWLERLGGTTQSFWSKAHLEEQYTHLPLEQYDELRNRPDLDGTSMLSPYLRFGLVSPRQIFDRVLDTTGPGVAVENGAVTMTKKIFQNSFVSELARREFRWHIYHHFPEARVVAFQEKRRIIKRQNREDWFVARQEGRTGYPIVDAGMRQLKAMHRMHGRVRMIVASFLCKDLHIDRAWGEKHFANRLLDYDEAVNMGNRQRSASVGADPKPLRIFNPILQSQKFDPQAVYIKKRLPELAHHTAQELHDPLTKKLDWYEPIVNHFDMSKRARELYKHSLHTNIALAHQQNPTSFEGGSGRTQLGDTPSMRTDWDKGVMQEGLF